MTRIQIILDKNDDKPEVNMCGCVEYKDPPDLSLLYVDTRWIYK